MLGLCCGFLGPGAPAVLQVGGLRHNVQLPGAMWTPLENRELRIWLVFFVFYSTGSQAKQRKMILLGEKF